MMIVTSIFGNYFNTKQMCHTITQKTYYEYLTYLKEHTRANERSIQTYCTGLRAILKYFMQEGYIAEFPIKLPKATKKIKETYTDAELMALMKKPNLKKCRFSEYRSWVLVNFLLGTGNRLNTVRNIKIKDIDFDNSAIVLTTVKNKRQQIVPLSRVLSSILIEYLKYRKGEPEDYLFCNQYGGQMTLGGIQTAVKRYNRSRGVFKTSLHAFRHTFAKLWIMKGGDLFRLQKLLGHSSVEMVKEYVEMFQEDLKVNYDYFNPLEKYHHNRQHITMR